MIIFTIKFFRASGEAILGTLIFFPNDFSRRVPKKNGRANEDYHQEFNPEIQETGEKRKIKKISFVPKAFFKAELKPKPNFRYTTIL